MILPQFTRAIVVLLVLANAALCEEIGLRAPHGFRVELFADENLANDIYSLTIDAQGRVAVAGPGYVRLLIDHNGDGRADEARQFSDFPTGGAQGMYFDGNDLYCTGDGGLLRLRDADGDGRADGPPERLVAVKTGGEHDAHAVRKGSDGWWYVIAGNHAGVDERFASLASSPIRRPHAGAVIRLSPDFRHSEIVADGFRNAYDFDFNAQGDLFVYDSDGERDVSLPWYQPTRLFHAVPGSSAGWITMSWKRPDYFFDMMPVVGRFGRGSPTGVECYRHEQFPPPYRGAVFLADWTFGRVLALPLDFKTGTGTRPVTENSRLNANEPGASPRFEAPSPYTSEPIEFLTGVGNFGFAPTDLAVGPDGSLFVSVGGRGTRGSVYRVRYVGDTDDIGDAAPQPSRDDLSQCLRAPQPLASWSRARVAPLAESLERQAFATVALDKSRPDEERVRAVEILVEHFGGLEAEELLRLFVDASPRVRARAAWSLRYWGLLDGERGAELAAACLADDHPLVARSALEAILGAESVGEVPRVRELITRKLNADDAFVRQAAARVAARLEHEAFAQVSDAAAQSTARAELSAHYAAAISDRMNRAAALRFATRIAVDGSLSEAVRLDAARLAQIALGDVGGGAGMAAVFDGYSGPLSARLSEAADAELHASLRALVAAYPTGVTAVDYELARAIALAGHGSETVLDRVLQQITPHSHPTDDVHHLIVAARIPAPRSSAQRETIAAALVEVEPKLRERKLNQDRHWELRMSELYARLAELDPQLPRAIAAHEKFGGPGSLLFVKEMDRATRHAALEKIVSHARDDQAYPWTGEMVSALAETEQPEYLEIVRSRIDDLRVRDAVLLALARQPQPADREQFVSGLEASSYDVVEACLSALAMLPASDAPREQAALIRLARRLGSERRDVAVRDDAIRLLRRNTGRQCDYEMQSDGPQFEPLARWADWLSDHHPQEAHEYLHANADDLESFSALLNQVDWESGDATHGERLFATRACGQCHQGRGAVGPDLAGITRRFSREDVFIAIALPSRDVSSRYQTTSVETTSGKTYTGLVVYESVDGLTLRDRLNQTIRIEADEIESQRSVPVSLMPVGLLDGLEPQDLADLYAYLERL